MDGLIVEMWGSRVCMSVSVRKMRGNEKRAYRASLLGRELSLCCCVTHFPEMSYLQFSL